MSGSTTTALGDMIEFWPLAKIAKYERNAKKHSDDQVEGIAASIAEYGWTMPALIRTTGVLIAGHGRDLAAALIYQRGGTIRMASGATIPAGTIPVIVARGWSEAQCRAYAIADNRLTELGEWDDELLRLELGDLKAEGFNLNLTGFSEKDFDKMLAQAANAGAPGGAGSLADRFGIPPFSVLNAREGWWQDRKRAWIALGIKSELGRGAPIGGAPMPMDRKANATPGGAAMPAADYSKNKARGDGRGRAVKRG